MPFIRFLFIAVPVVRKFLKSRQGKAAMTKARSVQAKRAQKKAASRGRR